jgi:hypothetical protein
VDELRAAILSIVSNPNPDALPSRVVALKEGLVEIPVEHDGLWADLDVTLTRQHTTPRLERVGTSAGSPMLHHDGASTARRQLESTVWYWIYLFANTNQHLTFDPFSASVPEACAWVAQFPGLIASLEGVEDMWADFLRDVEAAARVVDTDPGQVYLGECGAAQEVGTCRAHLYALKGKTMGACPVCGAGWFADERQAALVAKARSAVLIATDVSRLLGQVGVSIAPSTIRNYAMSKVVKGEKQPPKLEVADYDSDDRPRYLVGDVLDVFLGSTRKAA